MPDYAMVDFGYAVVLLLFLVLLVWVARFVWRTRLETARESETAALVSRQQDELADLQRRVALMEKLLKDVD